MAKIWVYIKPSVIPDGKESKTALTKTLTTTIETDLAGRIGKSLPADKFTTKETDKPKGIFQSYNGLKVTAELKFKVETKGSQMKVTCTLKVVFEAIKTQELKIGELLASASKGAAVERRGSGERAIVSLTSDALDNIVEPAVKQVMSNKSFISYGKSKGLPL